MRILSAPIKCANVRINASLPGDLSRSAGQLRRLFDRGERPTKREAATYLGCTERHVARVVGTLRAAGVPVLDVRDGRAKRFFLEEAHQRRGLHLDALDEEALHALTVAAQASEGALAGTSLAAPLRRAFGALLAALNGIEGGEGPDSFEPEEEPAHWHFGALSASPVDPDVFHLLARAVSRGVHVRVDYVNGNGERRRARELSPLALAPVGGSWLLAAFCHTRGAVRDFALARVSNVRVMERRPVLPPEDFDSRRHFAGRFGALQGDASVEVRLRVSPERAVYFRSKWYHPSQRVEAEPGGGLLVTFRVPHLDPVRAWVASWGPHVVALAPPELAARLAEDAAATARSYEAAPAPVPPA